MTTMIMKTMRMMTNDFPENSLLYYGSPIYSRDNLSFSGRVSGKGVALYHRSKRRRNVRKTRYNGRNRYNTENICWFYCGVLRGVRGSLSRSFIIRILFRYLWENYNPLDIA